MSRSISPTIPPDSCGDIQRFLPPDCASRLRLERHYLSAVSVNRSLQSFRSDGMNDCYKPLSRPQHNHTPKLMMRLMLYSMAACMQVRVGLTHGFPLCNCEFRRTKQSLAP